MRILFFCVLLAATATFGGGLSREQVEAYLVSQGRSFTAAGRAFEVDSTAGLEVGLAQTDGDVFIALWAVEGIERPGPDDLPGHEEALEILALAQDVELQEAKPADQKALENEYFALLDALPGDPVPQTPSLEEAKALVDERLGVALAAKYRELLSELDLELSRYSTTWWDDAARHDETDVPAEFLEALAMTDGEARQAQALSSSIALVVDDTGEVVGTARVLVSTDGVPVVVSDSASPVVPIEDQIAAFLQRLPAERARTRALQRSLAASIPTNAVLEDIEDLAAAFPRWEDNVGRQVHPGEFYTYDGTDVYRVVQGHVTQADWSPPLAPALFLHLPPAGPSGCPPFVQPTGAHDAYAIGDCVEFEGANYVSLIDANTYSPSAYPAGWELQE
jgi:hypothetical protein